MTQQDDPKTVAYYDEHAATYAQKGRAAEMPDSFKRFASELPDTAHVLDFGSGDGFFAQAFEELGHDVTATDASRGLADIASKRLKQPVRVARFDELDDVAAFDGVWAHASIHHAPLDALGNIIQRVHTSLKPGGIFHATVKTGKPAGRDKLDRFYSYPSRPLLEQALRAAGEWSQTLFESSNRIGYDGLATDWIILFARKAPQVSS